MRRIWGIRPQVLLAGGAVTLVAAVGAVHLVRILATSESLPATTDSDSAAEPGRKVPSDGTTLDRLREGASQVSGPAAARSVAADALDRVEAELAAATDPATVERLERKREMILAAMQRFREPVSPP